MTGPSLDNVSQASQPPIAIASSGITHITETRRVRRVVAVATPGASSVSIMAYPCSHGEILQTAQHLRLPRSGQWLRFTLIPQRS